jgi:hypothetical protein
MGAEVRGRDIREHLRALVFEISPAELALESEHPGTGLIVDPDLPAGERSGWRIVGQTGCAEELGVWDGIGKAPIFLAPPVADMSANVETAPVVRRVGRCLDRLRKIARRCRLHRGRQPATYGQKNSAPHSMSPHSMSPVSSVLAMRPAAPIMLGVLADALAQCFAWRDPSSLWTRPSSGNARVRRVNRRVDSMAFGGLSAIAPQ